MGGYMRLRNKMTGEIIECKEILILREDSEGIWQVGQGSSLAKLNEEWEDYKPTEPLIKDEKIRKAVRAWADACGAKQIKYSIAPNQYYDADMGTGFSIKFLTKPVEVYLEEGKIYTIAELCGEEENEQ